MKLSERIVKDNLPGNSIVQSYKGQIALAIEEGMWETWKHIWKLPSDTERTEAFNNFIKEEVG